MINALHHALNETLVWSNDFNEDVIDGPWCNFPNEWWSLFFLRWYYFIGLHWLNDGFGCWFYLVFPQWSSLYRSLISITTLNMFFSVILCIYASYILCEWLFVSTTISPWIWPPNGKILSNPLPNFLSNLTMDGFKYIIYDCPYFPTYEVSSWVDGRLIWLIVLWWWHISIMLWE